MSRKEDEIIFQTNCHLKNVGTDDQFPIISSIAFEHNQFFIVLSIKLLIAEFINFFSFFDFLYLNWLLSHQFFNLLNIYDLEKFCITLLNCEAPKRSCVQQYQLIVIMWLAHNRLNLLTKINNEWLTFARDPLTPPPIPTQFV